MYLRSIEEAGDEKKYGGKINDKRKMMRLLMVRVEWSQSQFERLAVFAEHGGVMRGSP